MIPFTVNMRLTGCITTYKEVCALASSRWEAMEVAHTFYPMPNWEVASVVQHSNDLVPTEYDRI